MTERHERIVRQITAEFTPILKGVLSEQIAAHYSEADWDSIVDEAANRLTERLCGCADLADIAAEGDLEAGDGSLNIAGIVGAVERLRDARRSDPKTQKRG